MGIHLCLEPGVTEMCSHTGEGFKYVNWLSLILVGVKGFGMFSLASKEWKQTNSQAKFVMSASLACAGRSQAVVDRKQPWVLLVEGNTVLKEEK